MHSSPAWVRPRVPAPDRGGRSLGLVLLLAACGGGGSDGGSPPASQPAAASAPTHVQLTGVTGTLVQGGTLQIQGNGFGAKTPVAPYFFDDFEGGTTGQAIWGEAGAVGTARWKMYTGGANTDSLYTSEGYRGQGAKRISPMNDFRDGYIDGINSPEVYVSYRFRYAHTGNWAGIVMKTMRIASLQGGNPVYSGQPALLQTYQPAANWLYSILSTDGTAGGSSQYTISNPEFGHENSWLRMQGYLKLSVPAGAANGAYFAGTLNAIAKETNKVTRASGYSGLVNSFLLPFTSANGGTDPGDTLTQWTDDVYFDTTQARVELCDQPLWTAANRNCDLQIPHTQWVDGQLQARVHLGSFHSGQTVYLFVVNSGGAVNANGWPLTIP